MAISTLTGVTILRMLFGHAIETPPHFSTGRLLAALAILALVHYFVNSGLVAIDRALKTGASMISTWRQDYLWTSLTYCRSCGRGIASKTTTAPTAAQPAAQVGIDSALPQSIAVN